MQKIKENLPAIIVCIIVVIIFIATMGDSGGSSKKSSKSYAEQYGYSVEDFYYKGSNGKWYPK